MEVFHYLAIKLKDVDNFDARLMDNANDANNGAIYNDFDPLDLGGITDAPSCSQCSVLRSNVSLDADKNSVATHNKLSTKHS